MSFSHQKAVEEMEKVLLENFLLEGASITPAIHAQVVKLIEVQSDERAKKIELKKLNLLIKKENAEIEQLHQLQTGRVN